MQERDARLRPVGAGNFTCPSDLKRGLGYAAGHERAEARDATTPARLRQASKTPGFRCFGGGAARLRG